ncbi:MAG: prolyl oligopeptidase family serine peptidase, partial [Planctomycetes bacterium]|nr:prolyl oligopeptidase family serine peptidase [Planctomycetota bacterium]
EPGGKEPGGKEPEKGEKGEGESAEKAEPAEKPVAEKAEKKPAAKVDPLEKKRPEGTELVLRDLTTGKERRFADVVAYGLTRDGKKLWLHTSAKKLAEGASYGLFVMTMPDGELRQVHDGAVHIGNVTFDRDEKVLAFTSDKEDFAADKPKSDLYLWEGGEGPARRVAYEGAAGVPAGFHVTGRPSFSRDGSVLDFDVVAADAEEPLPILPEDKVTLDLWHYQDGLLQTMQQKRGSSARNRARTAVYHRDQNRIVVLGDDRVESLRFVGPDGSRMIGTDGEEYEKEIQWDGRYSDVWLVNTIDGSRTKVLEKYRGNVSNSPGGRYLVWFGDDYHWWSYDIASGERRDLTGHLQVAFHRDDDDHPAPDSAHGLAGWTEGDAFVLLYDQFDLWKVSPATGEATCVTDGYGRANNMQLRIQRLPSKEDREYTEDDLLLAAVDFDTMAEGLFSDSLVAAGKPHRLYYADKNVSGVTRPVASTRFFFNQGTFAEYPDLWTANADFTQLRKLSDANPQQKEYRWGNSELVSWIDADGETRKGVLIKPDGFDPKKQYPMMVYFYERLSQNLHNYVTPAAGTSPNAAYYVSNGYLWFMPDIQYEIGYPGASCVKCVVSGVQSLIAKGFVDPKAVGAAGHSWGGYQTAFLVTRTHIFKAVESGAPVSNMLSAYGGIRYGTGMSRQFQYEQTQSRIGGTPWEYPLRYWENSPIHFADKVQTPVLILHNDNDGAVPWTQGIEYFVALKRLGKEAYLFNYNGEDHGLRNKANMKDWTRRMSEYFDHHLKGAPAPKWMSEGVPYADRELEKLPYAQSYIDAYVKPAPPEAVEASAGKEAGKGEKAAEGGDAAGAGPNASGQNGGQNGGQSGEGRRQPRGEGQRTGRRRAAEAPALKVKIGEAVPDFACADEAGKVHKPADYRGKKLLIWFYPKADTPGCTTEACGLRDEFAAFNGRDVAILGVSFDNAADNAAFRSKHSLPFPLLCDTDRAVGVLFGAADDASAAMARRIAVLVDADGKVEQVWPRVDPRNFATTVLTSLPQ